MLRMPITTAARRGISSVASETETHRVVLTSHGRPVAVVDSAERLDEDLRLIREASRSIVEATADLALARSRKLDLGELCGKLGIDVEKVRARATQLQLRQ